MYGAIIGDIVGSPYEFDKGDKTKDFPLFTGASRFTDDTVMTVAVAEAIIAFLDGEDYEDVIRTAVSLGGDTDTIGAMAGSIAEAFYGVPEDLINQANRIITKEMKKTIADFDAKFIEEKN